MASKTFIFFDLATTGLGRCDIIQVAAVCGENTFNGYTVPMQPISKDATDLTGFTVHDSSLYHNGVPMATIPLKDLLNRFIHYLRGFQNPILVAHNAKSFGAPVLRRVLAENGLQQVFKHVVPVFVDTLPLSKHMFPGLPSYSLKNLANHFLGQQFAAHNAVEDAKILKRLFYTWNPSDDYITSFFSSF